MVRPTIKDKKIRFNVRWKESLAKKLSIFGKSQQIFDHMTDFVLANWKEFKKFTEREK